MWKKLYWKIFEKSARISQLLFCQAYRFRIERRKDLPPSSSGLGHQVLILATGVRIP